MTLIVSPSRNHSPSLASAPSGSVGGATGPALKWLWVAVGVLGLSVVALGTTLVVQNAGRGAPPASLASQAAPAAPENASLMPNTGQAVDSRAPVATNLVADKGGQPSGHPVAAQGGAGPQTLPSTTSQAQYSQPTPPYPSAVRTAGRAPVCSTCGRIESVQAVQQAAPATGVGAVAGGVLGAVVGNQVGKGSGRTAATVLGAVGGGYVGHKVEERTRTTTVYQIAVRMDDGSVRRFTRAQPTAVGTPVVLQGKGFRVDEAAATRGEEPYPSAQPGAVRVANTY